MRHLDVHAPAGGVPGGIGQRLLHDPIDHQRGRFTDVVGVDKVAVGPFTLPPLNALRAFEAVARNLSFSRAAEESWTDTWTIVSLVAAVVLLSLGEAQAAEVLRHMDAKDVQKLGVAMATVTGSTPRSPGTGCR